MRKIFEKDFRPMTVQTRSLGLIMGGIVMEAALGRLIAVAFFEHITGYAVIFRLPTVLKSQSELSDGMLGVFGAAPHVFALIAMPFNTWHSDRSHERR
jgi:hypothetical protein